MHVLRKFTPFFILFFLIKPCFSQQETELTLKHVINNAVNNNINIVKLENSIEGQQSVIKTKYGTLFPTLSLSTGWTRSNQVTSGTYNLNGINLNLGTRNETSNNYNLSLRSDVTLFNGFSNYETIDVARMTETNLYTQVQKAKQDVVLSVLNNYITVLKNSQVVKINTASLEDSRAQLEKIKIFVEAGKRTMSDVYRQDVLVAQNELAVEQAKNEFDKSIADLVFTARLPQDKSYTVNMTEFNVDVSYESLEAYVAQNSNVEPLINNALKNRYDYKSSVQNLAIYEANLEITRNSLLFPTLTGFGSYSLSGAKVQNISDSKVFTIGLTLSYPIFEGFSIENQRQQALVSYKSANEDVKQVKDQIFLDIKKAVLDLKSLLKQIEITNRNIKSAEQDKYLAEESYRVGLGTLLDVQTATTNYNNLLINKSNLIYNFLLSQKQLEYYQGLLKY
jgi:outer membrane protein